MSMEISGSYSHYRTGYAQQLEAKETERGQNGEIESTDKIPVPHDEYISSEKSADQPSGLYWVGQGENGERKIFYDDPKKSDRADGNGEDSGKDKNIGQPKVQSDDSDRDKNSEQPKVQSDDSGKNKNIGQPKVKSDNPEKPARKCTGNTDQVDREIEKLKEKKKQLEQQIQSASGDEKKVEELKKELAQVESALSQKDNDTYRRQHTSFSE